MMKYLKSILVLPLFLLTLTTSAQEPEGVRLGPMLAYGSAVATPGIGAMGEFNLPFLEGLTAAPSFIFYFPRSYDGRSDWTAWELNANANYYFAQASDFHFYGAGGLNYTAHSWRYDIDHPRHGYKRDKGSFGLNIGGGAYYELGKNFIPFSELKAVLGYGQIVWTAGIKFNL